MMRESKNSNNFALILGDTSFGGRRRIVAEVMVVEMAVRAFVRRPEIEALPPFARRHKPRLALAAVEMPFTDEARAIARLLLFLVGKMPRPHSSGQGLRDDAFVLESDHRW